MITKRLWGIILVAVLVFGIGSICYAEVVDGDYMSAEGSLSNVSSSEATMTAMGYVYSFYAPAEQAEAIATLYKGGRYVDEMDTGIILDVPNPFGISVDGSSIYSGDWQGIGWNWVAWPGDNVEESIATYDPPLSSSLVAIDARQSVVAVSLGEYSLWNRFNQLTSPQVTSVIHDRSAVRLDVLFHTKVIPNYIETGDRMPMLLVSPDGMRALAVFEKADGEILCVPILKNDMEWSAGAPFVRGLSTVVE